MAELKTKANNNSIDNFLRKIENEEQKQDCMQIAKLMEKATGSAGRMWGKNIIGFGEHHYVYETGRENDWFQIGFSPRKQNISIYLSGGLPDESLLAELGKYKMGKGCLYIKSLKDVKPDVLEALFKRAVKNLSGKN